MATILFDLDGTLIDSASGIIDCLRFALKTLRVTIPDEAALRTWIGPPLRSSFATVVEGHEQVERAVALYHQHLDAVGWRNCTVFPGIDEVISELHADGHLLGIATAQIERHARRVIQELAFGDCLSEIVGATEDGQRTRKHELIDEAMRRLGAAREQCWMVGDRAVDIDGARACGIGSVGVLWGLGDSVELGHADFRATEPAELMRFFRQQVRRMH